MHQAPIREGFEGRGHGDKGKKHTLEGRAGLQAALVGVPVRQQRREVRLGGLPGAVPSIVPAQPQAPVSLLLFMISSCHKRIYIYIDIRVSLCVFFLNVHVCMHFLY